MEIAERLHVTTSALQSDQLSNMVNDIYKKLYRPSDLEMPPMHVGAFMFRDVFFPIRIPVIYGLLRVDLADFLTDIPEMQKEWLFAGKQSRRALGDQVIDLMDYVYGLDDLEKIGQLPHQTLEWWYMAKQQLEAAAATVLGSFNKYAVIQNCCISIELLLKGALVAKGIDKNTLKGYGHNLENLVNKTAEQLPNFDRETVLIVVKEFPDYVKSRYESKEFSRLDLGNYLMNTQFVGGEILRQFSDRSFRSASTGISDDTCDLTDRMFPEQVK